MEIKEQFVSYEIALKLKELGFNEECIAWYLPEIYEKGNICTPIIIPYARNWNVGHKDRINCPLWSQIFDWFRIEHGIHIIIRLFDDEELDQILYDFEIIEKDWNDISDYTYYHSFEECRYAGILMVIKMIEDGSINKRFE